jgi:hypothetical protein
MERKTILFLLQFIYNSLLFYFRVKILLLPSSLITIVLRMLPSSLASFKVCLPPKKQQHFIAHNLFKEFLINDEMGNETEVKCRISASAVI